MLDDFLNRLRWFFIQLMLLGGCNEFDLLEPHRFCMILVMYRTTPGCTAECARSQEGEIYI